jgi:hypothetical protein
MEVLPQSVGDEKMHGEVDCDAATVVDTNANDAEPFQHSVDSDPALALAGTDDVIRRFNRDTKRLAALVVSAMVSAALFMLAVLVQDRHPKAVDLTEGAVPAGGDLLLHANSTTLFKAGGLKGKKTNGEVTSGQASSVDHAAAEISPKENPSSQTAAEASTPTSVLVLTPEINHINAPETVSSRDSVRVTRPKTRSLGYTSSVVLGTVDVKKRLIALWHQSLARSEKSRTWAAYSNLNRVVRKKAAYTAETSH